MFLTCILYMACIVLHIWGGTSGRSKTSPMGRMWGPYMFCYRVPYPTWLCWWPLNHAQPTPRHVPSVQAANLMISRATTSAVSGSKGWRWHKNGDAGCICTEHIHSSKKIRSIRSTVITNYISNVCKFDMVFKDAMQNNGSGNSSADGGGLSGMPLYVGESVAESCFLNVLFCSVKGHQWKRSSFPTDHAASGKKKNIYHFT